MPFPVPVVMAAKQGTPGISSKDERDIRQLKVVLLGDSAVGKSSIAVRVIGSDFNVNQETTIGASFFSHMIPVDDGVVKMSLWDTAGQEKYRALAPMYYRGTQAAVVVYDVTNDGSFESAKRWVKEMKDTGGPDTFIALVGNKTDIEDNRMIKYEDAQEYANCNGLFFVETSAKTGQNIVELFNRVAKCAKTDPSMINRQQTIRVGRKTIRERKCCD